jgi:hypothetical protein
VPLLDTLNLGSGIQLDFQQEITTRVELGTLASRFVQIAIRNTQGRIKLKSIAPTGFEGMRRSGLIIG